MTEWQPIETRLRKEAEIVPHEIWNWINPLLLEAAGEIERLRGEVKELQNTCDTLEGDLKESGPW